MMRAFGEQCLGMGWGWIIGLIIIVAVIWIVVKLMSQNIGSTTNSEKTPIEILKERYAKGEIGKEEYEEKKSELKKDN